MHPSNSSILMAATSQGIYRTSDVGNNWTKVDSIGGTYHDIEFEPDLPDVFYASSSQGIRWSLSGGASWSNIPASGLPVPGAFSRCEIEVSPSAQGTIYALCGHNGNGFIGLYKSTDYGNSFTLMSSTPNILNGSSDGSGTGSQASYDLAMTIDPNNDQTIYIGGINVWKSTNSGSTWELKTDWRRIVPFVAWIHADIHDLRFKGNTIYACSDGGVYSSNVNAKWLCVSILGRGYGYAYN